ncbi:MAG TPA: outer membrane lipoprotein carrier protein LolA, partial [Bacteroidales bacterium]|nr:outer membrane lipoprotein carrier protein LolA [Bacteroidales bacterium]
NDPKAVSILDNFSSAISAAPSVSMKFLMITDDQMAKSSDTISGAILLSRDRYKLELQNNIIWYDGRDSWSYLPYEKEVTITRPDKNDNSFESRPSSIFTMYKKGYKSRLVEEKRDSYLIDLYPEEIKSELIRVRMTIKKPSLDLLSFEYKRRDGITITLLVQDYNLKQQTDPGMFRFNPEKYRDLEIIDMR